MIREGDREDILEVLEGLSERDLEFMGGSPETSLKENDICLVDVENGEVAGYILALQRDGDKHPFYTVEVAVKPKYRGKGISLKLGRELLKISKYTLCWRVEPENAASQKTVKALGGKYQYFDGKYDKFYIFKENDSENIVNSLVSEWFSRQG